MLFELILHESFLLEQSCKPFLHKLFDQLLHGFFLDFSEKPALEVWPPTQIVQINEDHTSSTDCCGRCHCEILDLKDESDLRWKRNTITIEKCKYFVVVEHCVH